MNILLVVLIAVFAALGVFLALKMFKKKEKKEEGPTPYVPPLKPKVEKIPKKYQFQETQFMMSTLSVFEALWTERIRMDDWKRLLDRFVKEEVGTWMRFFLTPAAPWAWYYLKWLTPIFKKKDGIYQIHAPWDAAATVQDYINPAFVKNMKMKLKEVAVREIGAIGSMVDNCGFHVSTASWKNNFLNPEANNRPRALSPHPHAYYLYADESNPGKKMKNTGAVIEALLTYLLLEIRDAVPRKYYRNIAFEACNEGKSGAGFHKRMNKIIDTTWGNDVPRERRLTSSTNLNKYVTDLFTPVFHHVCDTDSYIMETATAKDDFLFGISTDGCTGPDGVGFTKVPIDSKTLRPVLERAWGDGIVLFETLNGHRHNDQRLPGSKNNTTANKRYYDLTCIDWANMKDLYWVFKELYNA